MCLLGRMHSPEHRQILFLKGLDADVEAVDAGRPEAFEFFEIHRAGVGFEGHFNRPLEPEF